MNQNSTIAGAIHQGEFEVPALSAAAEAFALLGFHVATQIGTADSKATQMS